MESGQAFELWALGRAAFPSVGMLPFFCGPDAIGGGGRIHRDGPRKRPRPPPDTFRMCRGKRPRISVDLSCGEESIGRKQRDKEVGLWSR